MVFVSWWAERSLLWRMSLYIFWYTILITLDVCVMIVMASQLWLAVGPRSLLAWLLTHFKRVSFWFLITQHLWLMGRLGSRYPFNLTTLVDVATPDPSEVGPQSLCTRCLWWCFAPSLKGPPGASSNRIARPSVCLPVCNSVPLTY